MAPVTFAELLMETKTLLALDHYDESDEDELKDYLVGGCTPIGAASYYLLRRGKCRR